MKTNDLNPVQRNVSGQNAELSVGGGRGVEISPEKSGGEELLVCVSKINGHGSKRT